MTVLQFHLRKEIKDMRTVEKQVCSLKTICTLSDFRSNVRRFMNINELAQNLQIDLIYTL